jgi:hypothetical protein
MMPGDQLSADDALHALVRYGRWPLLRDAFVRFRIPVHAVSAVRVA